MFFNTPPIFLIFFLLLIALGSCDQGDACPAVSATFCDSNWITYGNSAMQKLQELRTIHQENVIIRLKY